jgi:hypothetical protein
MNRLHLTASRNLNLDAFHSLMQKSRVPPSHLRISFTGHHGNDRFAEGKPRARKPERKIRKHSQTGSKRRK